MTEQELLQAIRSIVQEELAPIKADIVELKENQEEIRNCVNTILGWTDKVSAAINFPLPKI